MKRIKLDRKGESIKKFVRSLSAAGAGSILELDGKPLVQVVPIQEQPIDEAKLRAAIRRRRDQSRQLNQDWDSVDQEMWGKIPDQQE